MNPPTEEPTPRPDAEFVITSIETLRVISEPLRMQLLELLADEPRTVKQLAGQLRMPAGRLYYHINLLELHKLIRVVGTRIVSGIIEKQYQAAAARIRVEQGLLALAPAGASPLSTLVTGMFEQLHSEIAASTQCGAIDLTPAAPRERTLLITRTIGRLPPARADEFYARLEALVRDFDALAVQPEDASQPNYRMVVVMYPLVEN